MKINFWSKKSLISHDYRYEVCCICRAYMSNRLMPKCQCHGALNACKPLNLWTMGEKSKYFHAGKPKFLSQLRSHAPKSAKIANIVITLSPRKGGSFGRFSDLAHRNIRHSSLEQKSWIFGFERNSSTSSNKMKSSPRGVFPGVYSHILHVIIVKRS